MLQVKNITKTFKLEKESIRALEKVTFQVKSGEFFTIIGPSGCGKSTLLRIIAGLEKPESGDLMWDEKPKIGFVFQRFALFPYLTVFENIAFGLKMTGVLEKEQKTIVKELIEEVGLLGFEDKHPNALSGGMKQRVGIARALAINPNVLLLDEPFSALDEFTAVSLRHLLLALWQKRHLTTIMITHLIREAIELSDTIAVMTPAPGTIEHIVPNTLVRPRYLRSKEFFSFEDKLTDFISP